MLGLAGVAVVLAGFVILATGNIFGLIVWMIGMAGLMADDS